MKTGYKPNRLQRILNAHPQLTEDQARLLLCAAALSANIMPEIGTDNFDVQMNKFTRAIEELSGEDVTDISNFLPPSLSYHEAG